MARRLTTISPRRLGLGLAILGLAFAGCSQFHGTTAASFMKTLRTSDDPNRRYVAYDKLGSDGCYDREEQRTQAVQMMVSTLQTGNEPTATRAVICRSLGSLAHPDARPALIAASNDPDGIVRAEALRALGRVAKPEDATIFARIMSVDSMEDCRIAAIEALASMKAKDPRVQAMLIAGIEDDDPAIRLASVTALRKITGQDHGVLAADWNKALNPEAAIKDPAAAIAESPSQETPAGPIDLQAHPAGYPTLPPAQ